MILLLNTQELDGLLANNLSEVSRYKNSPDYRLTGTTSRDALQMERSSR